MSSKDNLGDRIKEYEKRGTSGVLLPMLPVIIRLDGKAFHTYTKNFDFPFDKNLNGVMVETTKYLVDKTNALIGYTQSDEITLVLYTDNYNSKLFFDGKIYKLSSVLPSMASVKFYSEMIKNRPDLVDSLPCFDCRVFQVPNKIEAYNAILWRVQDAIRNSISSTGQAYFSHKELHKVSTKELIKKLQDEKGVNWNSFNMRRKEGTFVRRQTKLVPEIEYVGSGVVVSHTYTRSFIDVLELEKPFNRISNREEFIFDKQEPTFKEED